MVGRRREVAAVVVIVGLSLTGCGTRPEVLARIDGVELSVDGFQRFLEASVGQPWQAVDHRVATRLFDQYLDQEVVLTAGAGRAAGAVTDDPAVRTAAVRPLLGSLCGRVGAPPEAAVEREIERRGGEIRPRRARVRQLLLDELEAASAARRRVIDGEVFEQVSRDVSRAPNAASGGTLGLLEQGTLPPEIDGVVFALDVGEVSEPVRSPAGYHVFQVLEVVPAGPRPRAEVERTVRRELGERFASEQTRACLDRLAREVGVQVYVDHLWFQYDGRYGEDDDAGV
jgi:parvulin-like peptidyl-prolyl isomerase